MGSAWEASASVRAFPDHLGGACRIGRARCGYHGRVTFVASRRLAIAVCLAGTIFGLVSAPGCRAPTPEPITFAGRAITVENQTGFVLRIYLLTAQEQQLLNSAIR